MNTKIKNYFKQLTLKDYIVLFFTISLAIFLFYSLICTPFMGKADNGDFGRMYKFIGLSDFGSTYEEIYDGFFHSQYKVSGIGYFIPWMTNWVFGAWVLKFSLVLNIFLNPVNYTPKFLFIIFIVITLIALGLKLILKSHIKLRKTTACVYTFLLINLTIYLLILFNPRLTFDIRFVSIVYIVIFVLSIYWILKFNKINNISRIILGSLILLFFTDICYIGYFNSFFGEAATIAFLFMTIATLIRIIDKAKPTKLDFILFHFASFAFLTSKTQQLPLMIFMVLIYIALYVYYYDYKKLIAILSLATISIGILQFISICDYTNKNNIYQAVFTGILKDSNTPKEDLEALGLPTKFHVNAGPSFYGANLPFDPLGEEMLNEFYPNISLPKVLKFYLLNPSRAIDKFVISADNAYAFYKLGKSSFTKDTDYQTKFVNTFRTNLTYTYPRLHNSFIIFFTFSLVFLISICYHFFKSTCKEIKLLNLLLLFILAAGASQLVLPVIGSGEADFGKHLFLMNLAYDILLCFVIVFINENLTKKFKACH